MKGIAEGTIEWVEDPDFGYMVAGSVLGIDADGHRHPAATAAVRGHRAARKSATRASQRLKDARVEFLSKFPSLSEEIVNSVG